MSDGAAPGDDVLRIPRWLLAFILPAIGLMMAVARTEYRTNENGMATDAVDARVQRAEERVLQLERQVQWLCAQRGRDDFESKRAGMGSCP